MHQQGSAAGAGLLSGSLDRLRGARFQPRSLRRHRANGTRSADNQPRHRATRECSAVLGNKAEFAYVGLMLS